MKRQRLKTVIKLLVAVLLFVGGYKLGLRQMYADMDKTPPVYEEVFVEKGDKLWSICREYCPSNVDIRDYISSTMRLNNLSNSDIYPGDVIMVRVYADGR